MKKNKPANIQKTAICLIILVLSISLLSCSEKIESSAQISVFENTGFSMGTVIDEKIYSSGEDPTSKINELISNIENERLSSSIKTSEIYKINKNAGTSQGIVVSPEAKAYIEESLSIAKNCNGAFDPTVGLLTKLWDFDSETKNVPDENKIKELTKSISYKNVNINDNAIAIPGNINLDLGAIGKGIVADEIETYAKGNKDITGMLINIGGSSILTYGDKDTNKPWKVAITDPRDKRNFLGTIKLQGTHHISTSGDYEKYFFVDGKRYHHILDPKSGYPADSGLISVTVVSKKGTVSDSLSTACFVSGKEASLPLLKKYDADAIFVEKDKNVYITHGLTDKFQLTAPGYKLISD